MYAKIIIYFKVYISQVFNVTLLIFRLNKIRGNVTVAEI